MIKLFLRSARLSHRGFTLIEMAIVMLVIGLLLGGLLAPLSVQIEQQRTNETQKILANIKEALLGFALANGRLPCPASATSSGRESFCTSATGACTATTTVQSHGRCESFFNGFLPAATLGVTPVDSQGYALDAWGGGATNRIRYAVADNTIGITTFAFTAANGMRAAQMGSISSATLLYVCASATVINATDCGTAVTLSNKVPALIYSVGKNGATGGAGLDEVANPNPNSTNNDVVFVSHEQAPAGVANGEFDDIVVWISTGVLFSRMVAAGQLP